MKSLENIELDRITNENNIVISEKRITELDKIVKLKKDTYILDLKNLRSEKRYLKNLKSHRDIFKDGRLYLETNPSIDAINSQLEKLNHKISLVPLSKQGRKIIPLLLKKQKLFLLYLLN